VSQIAARYGPGSSAAKAGAQQFFVDPGPQLDYFVLNTHRPLFANVHMRQAVNYAIDRRALAALGDPWQPGPERPADHYLPPGIPGFRDAHVYPLTPDVAKARQLEQGRGRTAVLYTCNGPPCPEQARIVKTDLAAIGLGVRIKTFPQATMFARERKAGEPFDLAYGGYLPDYLDPAGMLHPLLADRSIEPTLNDPIWQRRLAATAQLSGPARYLKYSNLDVQLSRYAAPLLPFGNLSDHDFFSKRIGCQTNSIYGIDLGALCLKDRSSAVQ
jgi:ABC-type transport system substrate-binding protein